MSECYYGRKKWKVWWHYAIFIIHSYNTIILSFTIRRGRLLVSSSLLSSELSKRNFHGVPSRDSNLGLPYRLQQAAALKTELRREKFTHPSIVVLSGVIFSASKTNWIRIRISRRSTPSLHHSTHMCLPVTSRTISMLPDPDPHSQYGLGSTTMDKIHEKRSIEQILSFLCI
jgi:hypothetical protein